MTPLLAILFVLVAAGGTLVALERNPLHQTILASLLGCILAVLFVALHAPDVALSIVVVGGVAAPLMAVIALAKVRATERERRAK